MCFSEIDTCLQFCKLHAETSSVLNPNEKMEEPSLWTKTYIPHLSKLEEHTGFSRGQMNLQLHVTLVGVVYIQCVVLNKFVLVNVSVLERRLHRKTLY